MGIFLGICIGVVIILVYLLIFVAVALRPTLRHDGGKYPEDREKDDAGIDEWCGYLKF